MSKLPLSVVKLRGPLLYGVRVGLGVQLADIVIARLGVGAMIGAEKF
jgi:hypothetical protein